MGKKNVKKIQLTLNPEQKVEVFGLVSAEPDYKISMSLNKTLEYLLRSSDPVTIKSGGKEDISFSRFSDITDLPHSWISIVSNRSGNNTLLRKFPKLDYIVVACHNLDDRTPEEFAAKFRDVPHINGVFIIDKNTIDNSVLEAITPF